MAKIIEKIQLQLNSPDLKVKNNQHALTQGRSTVSALISITLKWYDATDNSPSGRKCVHAVFIDFRMLRFGEPQYLTRKTCLCENK